jgi:hypothetical protein
MIPPSNHLRPPSLNDSHKKGSLAAQHPVEYASWFVTVLCSNLSSTSGLFYLPRFTRLTLYSKSFSALGQSQLVWSVSRFQQLIYRYRIKARFWWNWIPKGFKLVWRFFGLGTTADCGCMCLHSLFRQWHLARRQGYSHRRALFKTPNSSIAKYSRTVGFVRLTM